jgi:diaminopimelate epimerase
MEGLAFYKMSGHGNDFLLVDNRPGTVAESDMAALVRAACDRKRGVGADGMVFIQEGPEGVDFAWRFFNDDGNVAEMCGNAARCAALFVHMLGLDRPTMRFLTLAGVIRAEVRPDAVKVQLPPARDLELDFDLEVDGRTIRMSGVNTGVPHVVIFDENAERAPVKDLGRTIRFHPHFRSAGTNVNFVRVGGEHDMYNRTYERGVEDETLACGTGCLASVLVAAAKGRVASPVAVTTQGGEILTVHFTRSASGFENLYLEGPVRVVCSGRLSPDLMPDQTR